MKFTTLIENNNRGHEDLACEHGLSLWIEGQGKKLLFDTGSTGAFIDNARQMGVDLSQADEVIISHAHFDHSGGVKRLLEEYPTVRRFALAQDYFLPKYKKTEKDCRYIGSRFDQKDLEQAGAQILWVDSITALCRGIYLIKRFARSTDYEQPNPAFVVPDRDGYRVDPFDDELALTVDTSRGLVVVAGCSHCGVVNLLRTVAQALHRPIYGVVGGSHLMEANDDRIWRTITDLKQLGVRKCWLSHCTGERASECFAKEFGRDYEENHTGSVIEF